MEDIEFERIPRYVSATAAYRRGLGRNLGNAPGHRGAGFLSVDHKKIGICYIVTAFAFLILGGIEALVMRLQLIGPDRHLLTPEQYDQLFSTHGMTMIFLYRQCRCSPASATIFGH
ncbi:MAG: cbb3-type cytochrome c oxidase subunit I [Rhodospirillales bacterium]